MEINGGIDSPTISNAFLQLSVFSSLLTVIPVKGSFPYASKKKHKLDHEQTYSSIEA